METVTAKKTTTGEDVESYFPINDGEGGKEEEEEMVVDFPDDTDAGEKVGNPCTNSIPWREVELNTWLRVIESFIVQTINGPATIIKLQKRDGSYVKAWTTKVIATALSSIKQEEKKNRNLFIKSIGKTKCKNSANSYSDFRFKLV